MENQLNKIIDGFNKQVVQEMNDKFAHHVHITRKKSDEWNFCAAVSVQGVTENLIQVYERQHQRIPITREAQLSRGETGWRPFGNGEYQGDMHGERRHGHGSFKRNGERYDGEWKEDNRHGLGVQ